MPAMTNSGLTALSPPDFWPNYCLMVVRIIGVVAGLAVPEYAQSRFHQGQSGNRSNDARTRCGGIRGGYGQRPATAGDFPPVPQAVRATRCNNGPPCPARNAECRIRTTGLNPHPPWRSAYSW